MGACTFVCLCVNERIYRKVFVVVSVTVLQIAISVDFYVRKMFKKKLELSHPKAKVKVVVLCWKNYT